MYNIFKKMNLKKLKKIKIDIISFQISTHIFYILYFISNDSNKKI